GQHDGAYAYTVGQRKGLALGRPAADGRPRYVLETNPRSNTVVVGPGELLSVTELAADQTIWLADDVAAAGEWTAAQVQVRAHGQPVDGQVRRDGDALAVRLEAPLRGLAPGESVVVYAGSRVLGQATLTRAGRGARAAAGGARPAGHAARAVASGRMRILVAGASGLIGTALQAELTAEGHEVRSLVRREPRSSTEYAWRPAEGQVPAEAIDWAEGV